MRGLIGRKGTWAALTGIVAGTLVGATTLARTAGPGAGAAGQPAEACADGYHATRWRAPSLSGADGDLDGALAAAAGHKVLFVGEQHARPAHQAAHLETVCRLHGAGLDVVVGVEFIQQPFQPYVDDYLAGRIDDAELRRLIDYDRRWGYPFELYAPVLRFARDHGLEVLALNVPAELTRKLATRGLEGLTEAERELLPAGFERAPRDYGARLAASYRQASAHHGLSYDRFELAQLAWDEGMAERIARHVLAEPEATVVILAGNGHVAWPGGIPERVLRRAGVRGFVLANADGRGAEPSDVVDRVIRWEAR